MHSFQAHLSYTPATHRRRSLRRHEDRNPEGAAVGGGHSPPPFYRRPVLISLGSALKLTFSRRQKYRLSSYQTLGQSHPQHQGAAREPHQSCPRAATSWHCCVCAATASSICPLHSFGQDLESPKICLRTSHFLSLQSLFLPFMYHLNPASSYRSISKFAAGARLCTTSFLKSSGFAWTRKAQKCKSDYV